MPSRAKAVPIRNHPLMRTRFCERLIVQTMHAFDNIEHTLRHTSNQSRILAACNVLQHHSLIIQQVRLLHEAEQQRSFAQEPEEN